MSRKRKQNRVEAQRVHENKSGLPHWLYGSSKPDLHALITDVKNGDLDAISFAVGFLEEDSRGLWHNRARAKLCRHFRSVPPSKKEIERIATAIACKLILGKTDQQFTDQLRFAIRHAPDLIRRAATIAVEMELQYIRNYGYWILWQLRINEKRN